MNSEWEPILKDVISDVLETMFFCMVDFDEFEVEDQKFSYGCEICLLNHNGRVSISLQASDGFARMITANLLGIDEEDLSEEDLVDSLQELANMIGGGYHGRINSAEWQLGIPKAWKLGNETGCTVKSSGLRIGCSGEPVGSAVLSYLPAAAN